MKKILTFLLVGIFYLSPLAQSNITITSSCENSTFCNTTLDCSNIFVDLQISATTDCSTGNDLNYSYLIDLFDDGTDDYSGSISTPSINFPMGVHRVLFLVEDQCNTTESCDYIFEVKDCTAPIATCTFGIATAVMPLSGELTINASSFESGNSNDNCSDYSDLKFSFSQDVNNDNITITCPDVPMDGLYPITLYVTDEAGNYDFCSTFVLVQDPENVCSTTPTTSDISVVNPNDCEIEGVDYDVNGTLFPVGELYFFDLSIGDIVTPQFDNNVLNGVTTYDLVLISKHILNIFSLDESWQLLAADANQNGVITTLDVALLRAVILQNIPALPNDASWIFQPSFFEYDGMMSSFEFLGIKLGDVNGTAVTPNCFQNPTIDSRTLNNLEFITENKSLKAGKNYTLNLFAKNYKDILGGQFTLQFDPTKLDFVNIEGNESIQLTEENFGVSKVEKGIVLLSWHSPSPLELDPNIPFCNITFTANQNGTFSELIQINSHEITNEVYFEHDTQIEFGTSSLNFEDQKLSNPTNVFPNPFRGKTTISFTAKNEGQVMVNIFDLNGRLIFSKRENSIAGENKIELLSNDLPAKGIYFFQIESANERYSGKLIAQ